KTSREAEYFGIGGNGQPPAGVRNAPAEGWLAAEHARRGMSGVEAGKHEVEALHLVALARELCLLEQIGDVAPQRVHPFGRLEQRVTDFDGHDLRQVLMLGNDGDLVLGQTRHADTLVERK